MECVSLLGDLASSLTGPGENSAPGVARHQRGVTPDGDVTSVSSSIFMQERRIPVLNEGLGFCSSTLPGNGQSRDAGAVLVAAWRRALPAAQLFTQH